MKRNQTTECVRSSNQFSSVEQSNQFVTYFSLFFLVLIHVYIQKFVYNYPRENHSKDIHLDRPINKCEYMSWIENISKPVLICVHVLISPDLSCVLCHASINIHASIVKERWFTLREGFVINNSRSLVQFYLEVLIYSLNVVLSTTSPESGFM